MHVPVYCGLLLVVATVIYAGPIKSSNGCGYAVRECEDISSIYTDYDAHCRHVT
jgi:hypothetical protein